MSIPNQTATLSKEDYDIFLEKVEIAKTKGVTIEYSLKVDTFVPSWEITLLNNTLSVDELDELTTEA
tara:strand:- start:240 stop:440 length:201 start_codon:yes stop_codon:yes gene_type:complete